MLDVEYEPLTGSPAALVDHAAAATRTAERLDDARARLVRIHHALEAQRSHAVTTAQDRLTDIAERLSVCSGVLRSSAAVVHGHADTLAAEQSAAMRAIARRDEALQRERSWRTEAARVRLDTLATLVPSPAESAQQHLAETRLSQAEHDVRAAEADWRRARDAKRAASVQAAASIEALAEPRAVSTFARSGVSVEAFQRAWTRGLAAAGVVDAAVLGGGGPSGTSGRTELRRALLAGGEDMVFWSAFWSVTTPGELYSVLGLDPLDTELTDALRTGAERWSQSATPAELTAFGRSVVDGLMPTGVGLSEQAAIAAVLLSPALPGPVHAGAAEALEERRRSWPPTDADLTWTAPATIAVANGLLAHPRTAFDHLAPEDDEVLADRALLWFGLAPPDGWPDGGEAVAGALVAAVVTGARSPARSDQARSALLVTHATGQLPQGMLAVPGTSDLASSRVARAYEPYVPVFGDVVIGAGAEGAEAVRTSDRHSGGSAGSSHGLVQPDIDAFALVDVISATSKTDAGAAAWLGVGDRYHDSMLGRAFRSSDPLDRDLQDAISQEALRDVGVIAGALQAEHLQVARERQGTLDGAVEGASFLAGALTVDANPAVSIGITAATTVVPHLVPDHVGPVKDTVLANEQTLRHRFAEAAYAAAIESEVEAGLSAARAAERRAELSPDSHATRGAFQQTYDLTADLRRELRDNQ